MEKYYVSGCRDDGEATVACEDSEATSWTLYARDDKGMSRGIIDLAFREDAEAAMAVYAERDALQEQVQKLAAESASYMRFFCYAMNCSFEGGDMDGGHIQDIALEFGLVRKEEYNAEKHSEMSSDPGAMEEGDEFFIINDKLATDAVIREIGAKSVAPYIEALPKLAGSFLDRARNASGKIANAYAVCAHEVALLDKQLRAGEQP